MKIIVGLGNPGSQYEYTRHNIGFLIVDRLAQRWGATFTKSKFNALMAETRYGTEKIVLLKPQTYMNLSGQAVGAVVSWHKACPEDVMVVYDDLDMDFTRLKFRPKGSSGGHNGIKSLISHLGTDIFPRMKFGIERPRNGQDTVSWVLSNFPKEHLAELAQAIDQACDALEYYLEQGMDAAMNQYNVK